jgi:hypothetical protein
VKISTQETKAKKLDRLRPVRFSLQTNLPLSAASGFIYKDRTMAKFTANYQAIAQGIYAMLKDMADKGDESYITALAFGMLPAPLMQMAEKEFVRKLAEPAIKIGCPTDLAQKAVRDSKKEVIEFNHQLSLALLRVAKENNNLVV